MRLSLGYQVIGAVLLGILSGLFFGPLCSAINPIADIYIMLLQMVALPYICFSLIHGLGSMNPKTGKKIFYKGWPFWLTLWGVIFVVIYVLNQLIPKAEATTIAVGSLEGTFLAKNFINYLVPENPFYDLANNVVPAVAVFGLIVGVSLMHLEKKEPVLSFLERSNELIEKILKWLAIISPIGIFSHIAVAFGTVYFSDLVILEFYVVCFILATLFITFWVLPALLSSLTPLSYKEVLSAFRMICLLPFATALPTLALPFIIVYMKKLGQKHAEGDPHFHSTSQTVMPICYCFGQIGNALIFFFILFLSFFFRHPFSGSEKAILTFLTIPLSIGTSATSINAVSFLIEQLGFPQESIDMYVRTMAITLNFQVLLSIASVLTFIILVLYSYYGLLKIRLKRLFSHLGAMAVVLALCVTFGKFGFHLKDNFQNRFLDLSIDEVITHPIHAQILTTAPPLPAVNNTRTDPLALILEKGVLKVGYSVNELPHSYLNDKGELVGFDIAYAYELARDLDATLQFIPIDYNNFGEQIERELYDIAMSSIIMDENRIKYMDFTHPYEEQNIVLVVPAAKHTAFLRLDALTSNPHLKFCAMGAVADAARRHFPLATIIETENYDPLLKGEVDGWVSLKTNGFVWTLSHPQFDVIDFGGLLGKRYVAYPVKIGSSDWISFLNNWLVLKEQSGFKTRMIRYWLKGESLEQRPPRWSIIRNVLHWI